VNLFDSKTQVFILRLWLEPREIEGAKPEWRGVIEYVRTRQRRYFSNLEELPPLILPYLRELEMDSVLPQPVGEGHPIPTIHHSTTSEENTVLGDSTKHKGIALAWIDRLRAWLQRKH
jgi:hypothetical protein